jgi:hypothetical protein
VQRGEPLNSFGDSRFVEHVSFDVDDTDVVMGFRPVDPDEDHPSSFLDDHEPEEYAAS